MILSSSSSIIGSVEQRQRPPQQHQQFATAAVVLRHRIHTHLPQQPIHSACLCSRSTTIASSSSRRHHHHHLYNTQHSRRRQPLPRVVVAATQGLCAFCVLLSLSSPALFLSLSTTPLAHHCTLPTLNTVLLSQHNTGDNEAPPTTSDLDVAVFRFTLGIPGFDDSNIPRVIGAVVAALVAVNHVLSGADPTPPAQVCL